MSADESWKITVLAPRDVVQAALVAHEDAFDWDADIVIAGSEIAEDRPEEWQLEAWLGRKPTKADEAAVRALFGETQVDLEVEKLPDEDWVTLSQHGVEPIREGRFHVHTPEYPALDGAGVRNFLIPTSQAFGTGQHATTAGCLAMLDHMKREGLVVREEPYSIEQWRDDAASGRLVESFACGTAAVVTPIGRVAGPGYEFTIGSGSTGQTTQRILDTLNAIQRGRAPDPHGWREPVLV